MARPKVPILSTDRVAKAAMDVVDTHGLEGFALALVADRLGVKAPSLYHHFANKDELLAQVARRLLTDFPLPPLRAGVDWRKEIVAVSLASWRSVLRHPRAAPLLLMHFPRHLLINAYEHWATLLSLNEVPAEWHLRILEGAERLTFGSAMFAAASRSRGVAPFPNYDTATHPKLTMAIRTNPFDEEGTFIEALRCFLRGVPDRGGQASPGEPSTEDQSLDARARS